MIPRGTLYRLSENSVELFLLNLNFWICLLMGWKIDASSVSYESTFLIYDYRRSTICELVHHRSEGNFSIRSTLPQCTGTVLLRSVEMRRMKMEFIALESGLLYTSQHYNVSALARGEIKHRLLLLLTVLTNVSDKYWNSSHFCAGEIARYVLR